MIVAYSEKIATIEASRLRPMEESFLCWGCKVKLPDHLDHDSHKADSEDLGRDKGIAESDKDLGKDKDNAEPEEDQGKSKGNDETEDLSEDSGSTDSDDDRFGCGNIRRGDVCMCLEKQAPGEIDCYFGDFLFIRETGVDGACVYARNLRTGVDGWLDVTVRGVEIRPIRCLADVLHWRDALEIAALEIATLENVWRASERTSCDDGIDSGS